MKNIPIKSPKYDAANPKYNKLSVDRLPIIKKPEKFDYKQLLRDYKLKHGKELKPVKSRGKNPVPHDVVCHRCGAPHIYLYDNTGGRGQLLCKVCGLRFNKDKKDFKIGALVCPYCGRILVKKKKRKYFNIHKCVNEKCSFYLQSLKNLSPQDLKEYKKDKHKFKLHYIYREFTIDYFKVDLSTMLKGCVNLTFRNFSPHVLGLCLTYLVNLGLSTRATFRALWEIHGVKISHVMVSKYAKTAAALVQPLYKLAQQWFMLKGMDFDLTQVIGLTNDDPVSTEYRKQIIERLNRTFKRSYQVTNGYGGGEGSNTHVSLFVAYYNFLRPHSYTYWQPLNSIPELESIPNMLGKWQKLIELSQQFILSRQTV